MLTGEYAVLRGAPALVMAVNRYATCHCSIDAAAPVTQQGKPPGPDKNQAGWHFTSQGFAATSHHTLAQLAQPERLANDDPARLCAYLVNAYRAHMAAVNLDLPSSVHLELNSAQMYHEGAKLGLGSSAALTVAMLGIVQQLAQGAEIGNELAFEIAHSAHRASQGGVGSGLDIATSLNGGVVRFQNGHSEAIDWPESLGFLFVYAGVPASTTDLVSRFDRWHKNGTPKTLQALKLAASELADDRINIDNLQRYTTALKTLDRVANIGIFSAEHLWVAQLAERLGVVYKPCGAGGGDLGIAISDEPSRLARFAAELRDQTATDPALNNRLSIIDLEPVPHGLTNG